jgi:predicted SprT family Zn-dependent metalloprotease
MPNTYTVEQIWIDESMNYTQEQWNIMKEKIAMDLNPTEVEHMVEMGNIRTMRYQCQRCLGEKAFLVEAHNYSGPSVVATFCRPCQRELIKTTYPSSPTQTIGRYCSGPSFLDNFVG